MRYSIAFIAPYKKLADLFLDVCREFNKDIQIEVGDLKVGAQKALELEKLGYDVLISRGGTSTLIKEMVKSIPVVDIHVSGFDLIRLLNQVKRQTKKVALVGFEPFTHGIEGFGQMMGMDLKVLTLREEWNKNTIYIEECLKKLQKEGYKYIVGDNISVKTARELGMKFRLIRSGKEALARSIFEAERVAHTRRNEMKKTKRIKSIVDSAYEGIIGIDKKGIIDLFNPRASEIFSCNTDKVLGKHIKEILPESRLDIVLKNEFQEKEQIWTIGDRKIAANVIPIKIGNDIVGVVVTCQEVSRIQQIEHKIRKELYLKGHVADNTFEDILGVSLSMVRVKEEARDYARIDAPLLIYGETGTGKELFAQAVHNASPRKNKPFVAFNCAAIPENLLESELFGYVEGAFTGARSKGKPGFFEQAHEGTIFLDEIGEISSNIQVRLLRVIQEMKVRRLGDDKITPIDVRIIVATNKNLHQLVQESCFREDLFYRINVLNLNLPPLRERKEDIPILVAFFIRKYNNKLKKTVSAITDYGLNLLQKYSWPGNIRQLENIVERLVIRSKGTNISNELVQDTINSLEYMPTSNNSHLKNREFGQDKLIIPLDCKLHEIEKRVIREVVKRKNGNKQEAANHLGIGRTTLWRKLKDDVSE